MGAGEEILRKLVVIEAKLDRLLAGASSVGVSSSGSGAGACASDDDLDGQYGDPVVKFSPKRWKGADYKGVNLSRCPADFLDVYAGALQYASEHPKAGKEKYAQYDARDAARARGWAARALANPQDAAARQAHGATPAEPMSDVNDHGEPEIPF